MFKCGCSAKTTKSVTGSGLLKIMLCRLTCCDSYTCLTDEVHRAVSRISVGIYSGIIDIGVTGKGD